MFLKAVLILSDYMFLCGYMFIGVRALATEAKWSVESPGAGATGSCELPNVSVGNQTLVLCKNNKSST